VTGAPCIIFLLCLLQAWPAGTATGQTRDRAITGIVVDGQGAPLAGAHVLLAGRDGVGTSTGPDGRFTLEAPASGSLRVIFVGFEEKTVALSDQSYYFIQLVERVEEIEEVLVVGYGVQRKESVVGAISQVKGEELVRTGQSSITNALAGKLSGVATIQRSGMPGSDDAEIVIRGLSSFNSSSPLVLVDGVERDFASIDPNEVSSVSVLKDASATAVFGARGANGVIIVTTRRGTEGRPRLSFSFSAGMQLPINVAKHVDAYTTMSLLNVALMNDRQFSSLTSQAVLQEYANPSSRLNSIQYPDVNWFEELTEPFAPSLNANFNIQGGTKFVKYFASVGYAHQGSLFKSWQEGKFDTRFYYNRVNYRANLDFNLTGSTVLSFNLGGSVGIQNKPVPRVNDAELWKFVFGSSTTKAPMYYPAWVMEEVPDPDYPGLTEDRLIDNMGDVTYNPYFVLAGGKFNQYTDSKLFSDISLHQQLDFITRGLSVKGKFSLSTYYKYNSLSTQYTVSSYTLDFSKIGTGVNPWERAGGTNEVYTPSPSYTTVGGLSGGYYHDLYYDMSLNYARSFGPHAVTGLLLLNRQEADKETAFTYYNEAVVGRVTYDYAHKYLVELNMGYTGSERFAPGNRFGFFPSAAVGWVLSEEKFFRKALPRVDKLKLRFSQGLVGSDYARNRWLYISEFSKDANGAIKEDPSANTVAQWEEAMKRDLGIEAGLLGNRLLLSVDLFDEKRSKMLIPVSNTVPMWVGNSYKELNKGKIKKHGFEVDVEWRDRLTDDFSYHARGNFGFNENRILYQDDAPYALSHQKQTGTAIGAQRKGAYLVDGDFYTSVDDIHGHVSALPDIGEIVVGDLKFLDYMADGLVNRDDLTQMKGSTQPPIGYAFGGGFKWKGLDFSFLFQGYAQKYINFDQMYEYEFYKGNYRVHVSQQDYWSPANPNGNHGALHYTSGWISNLYWSGVDESETNAGYAAKMAGKSWRRADFLRLKEVYIAYSLESARLKELMGVRHVRLYVTGNNLLTFTPLIEGDPENTYLLYGNYPQMMTIKGGLEISF
jgi:TonB-linked SusC/RagA family outer membrane protein